MNRSALMAARLAWRQALAALRAGGATRLLLIALVVAVAAVTAVTRLTDRVDGAMRTQGSQTLAADLKLMLTAPISDQRLSLLARHHARTAPVATFPSAISAHDRVVLVAVKAVGPAYPLRGQLTIRRGAPGTPTQAVSHGPPSGAVWVDQSLLDRLDLHRGQTLPLGNSHPKIAAVLVDEPDRSPSFINIAPRVMIANADIAATGLIGPGSRIHYAELIAASRNNIRDLQQALTPTLAAGERLQTPAQANRGLSSALAKAGLFLNLSALAAVVLAGVAIALSARQHARARLDEIALLKTLGAGRGVLRQLLAWQLGFLGLGGVAIGLAVGELAELGLGLVVHAGLGVTLPVGHVLAAWPAPLVAFTLLAGFAWPAVASALGTPPARVLSRSSEGDTARRWPVYLTASISVSAMAAIATNDLGLTAAVLLTVVGGALVFALGGWLLLKILAWVQPRIGNRFGPGLRLGVDALLRRRGVAIAQCVALGMGLTLIFMLVVVRGDLLDSWRASVSADAPNRFLINITPDQTGPIGDFLSSQDIQRPTFYPIVRARLTRVNKQSLAASPELRKSAGGLSRRALNLSWMARLKADNELVKGHWWTPADRGKALVSLDDSVARRLDLSIGDTLAFDIAGQSLTVRVASIRHIDWSSLQPNFFVLAPPGLLDHYPQSLITGFFLPPNDHKIMAQLVQRFPNVSVIDIGSLLAQIENLIDQVSLAVELVFGFTLLAGLVVLVAAQSATRDVRRREAAVLRAIGARGTWLRQSVWAECLFIGTTTTLLAAAAAQIGASVIATHFLHLEYHIRWDVWLVAILFAIGAIALAGALTLGNVMQQPAWTVLRQADAD
ncbi:MAG: hypothetical protein PF501_04465 [Salinisphaera sp.]|jgi:putative ABC transport system permease protein|nr:hypothetical protein [Salinisphaera sp.]